MKKSVLIIESYDDEPAGAVLLDYDLLPLTTQLLVDRGLKTKQDITCDTYVVGLQSLLAPELSVEIKPSEVTTFLGTVYFYHGDEIEDADFGDSNEEEEDD